MKTWFLALLVTPLALAKVEHEAGNLSPIPQKRLVEEAPSFASWARRFEEARAPEAQELSHLASYRSSLISDKTLLLRGQCMSDGETPTPFTALPRPEGAGMTLTLLKEPLEAAPDKLDLEDMPWASLTPGKDASGNPAIVGTTGEEEGAGYRISLKTSPPRDGFFGKEYSGSEFFLKWEELTKEAGGGGPILCKARLARLPDEERWRRSFKRYPYGSYVTPAPQTGILPLEPKAPGGKSFIYRGDGYGGDGWRFDSDGLPKVQGGRRIWRGKAMRVGGSLKGETGVLYEEAGDPAVKTIIIGTEPATGASASVFSGGRMAPQDGDSYNLRLASSNGTSLQLAISQRKSDGKLTFEPQNGSGGMYGFRFPMHRMLGRFPGSKTADESRIGDWADKKAAKNLYLLGKIAPDFVTELLEKTRKINPDRAQFYQGEMEAWDHPLLREVKEREGHRWRRGTKWHLKRGESKYDRE